MDADQGPDWGVSGSWSTGLKLTMSSATSAILWATPDQARQNVNPERMPIKALDQQDFLRLLVTQITQQDPLNPKTDTEFIGQMAQFSSLEQARAMQADLSNLRTEQQLARAQALVGQTVEIRTAEGSVVHGPVTGFQIEKGQPKLLVGGEAYDLSEVISASPAPRTDFSSEFTQASALVGQTVEVETEEGWLLSGPVTGVEIVEGRPRIQVNGQAFALDRIRHISAPTPYDPLASEMSRWRTDQQFLQANALVGRVVELQIDQESTLTGKVSSVKIEAGTPKLIVDGRAYDLSRVISISPVDPETST
jgi:flagellar basal-body rod modification protein FlgD